MMSCIIMTHLLTDNMLSSERCYAYVCAQRHIHVSEKKKWVVLLVCSKENLFSLFSAGCKKEFNSIQKL